MIIENWLFVIGGAATRSHPFEAQITNFQFSISNIKSVSRKPRCAPTAAHLRVVGEHRSTCRARLRMDVSRFQKLNLRPIESDDSAPLRRRSPKPGGYFEVSYERASVLDCGDGATRSHRFGLAARALVCQQIADARTRRKNGVRFSSAINSRIPSFSIREGSSLTRMCID